MSIRLMTVIWNSGGFEPAVKAVFLALADYASDTGKSIYPSLETLAWKTAFSKDTCRRALVRLQEYGLLHIERDFTPNSPRKWRIDVYALDDWAANHRRGSKVQPLGSQVATTRDSMVLPNPSLLITKEASVPPDGGTSQFSVNLDELAPPALEEAGQGKNGIEGRLPKIQIAVPQEGSHKYRDEYTSNCPHCSAVITQKYDTCPDCRTPVAWTGSRLANEREQRKRNQIEVTRAKTLKAVQQSRLGPGAKFLVTQAILRNFHPGKVTIKPEEAIKADEFAARHGIEELQHLIDKVVAKFPNAGGRGLIVTVLGWAKHHRVRRQRPRVKVSSDDHNDPYDDDDRPTRRPLSSAPADDDDQYEDDYSRPTGRTPADPPQTGSDDDYENW